MIPYGRQEISQADIDAVVEVLKSDFLTQGPKVPAFEDAITAHTGAEHTVVCSNATSALHLACLSLNLGPGDWLWTSPITFVASANCARYCGARVDFVDIDPNTNNMCPIALEAKLMRAATDGKLPKIVVPVHLSGQSCDMKAIFDLASRFGFKVIEDASHAIGGKYSGRAVGNCAYSDICVFSFHPVKIITTAEGGAATTNNTDLMNRMRLLRSHGISRDPEMMTSDSPPSWYYEQLELGFNYRMTDLQAALGLSQLKRVDEFVQRRHQLAERYNKSLQALPLQLPKQIDDSYSALHLYIVRVKHEPGKPTHKYVFDRLRASGIGVNLHYIPVHTQPYYQQQEVNYDDLPESLAYYSEAISLPMYHHMTGAQQDEVITALFDIYGMAP
jgi:UDP-4-amino-4,6-dideoxy-N-acetyl-beta-L-altrosamine transaminase